MKVKVKDVFKYAPPIDKDTTIIIGNNENDSESCFYGAYESIPVPWLDCNVCSYCVDMTHDGKVYCIDITI